MSKEELFDLVFRKKIKKATAITMIGILLIMMLLPYMHPVLAATTIEAYNDPVQGWQSFTPYTDRYGNIFYDPANEPGISPDDVDFTSGAMKGIGDNPSFYIAGDDSYLFFRVRLLGDPRDDKGGFLSSVWLVHILQDGVRIATVGLNGKSPHEDYIYVSNANGSVISYINKTDESGINVPGTRVTEDSNGDYFLDFQVPISRLTEIDQSITSDSILQFSFATSKAANLTVVNKDYVDGNGAYVKIGPSFSIYSPTISFSNLGSAYESFPTTISGTTSNAQDGSLVTLTITPPGGSDAVTSAVYASNNSWSVTGLTGLVTEGSYVAEASVVNENGDTATTSEKVDIGVGSASVTIDGTDSYSAFTFPNVFSGTYVRTTGGSRRVNLYIYQLSDEAPQQKTLITSAIDINVTGSPGSWNHLFGSYPDSLVAGKTYRIEAVAANNSNLVAVQTIKYLGGNIAITEPLNNTRSGNATPTVIGTANLNAKVEFYINDQLFREIKADEAGNWSAEIDRALSPSPSTYHQFKAVIRDDNGNTRESVVNYGVDAINISIENGSHPYVYINNLEPTIRGRSTDTLVNIEVSEGGNPSNSFSLTNIPVTNNKWSVKVPLENRLKDNSNYVVTATTVQDSSKTATLNLQTKSSTSINIDSPVPGSNVDVRSTITGTSEPNAIIDLNLNNSVIIEVTADEAGNWTYTPASEWKSGINNVIATTSDDVGNTAVAETYFSISPTVHTVTFDNNGGDTDASPTTKTAEDGKNVGTLPTAPTKMGYTFAGWNTAADGSGIAFDATTPVTGDITVYAQWNIEQYTVSFDSKGGSAVAPITAEYSSTITAPAVPTKEGYSFAGWYSDIELTTAYNFATVVTENITLFAKWIIMDEFLLAGTIIDKETGVPIDGAKVIMQDLAGKVIGTYVTQSDGQYSFENLRKNRYNILVQHSQYSNSHREVQVSSQRVVSGMIVEDFELVKYEISLTANPSTIIGNGIDVTMLTATVLDKDGSPLEGVEVVFSAAHGFFYEGNTTITDSDGKAKLPFRSESLNELTAIEFPVTATVADNERGLYAQDQIYLTFAPGSIQGIVIDNVTGLALAGTKVVIEKDFDGDGIVDFVSTVITGSDGRYSIPVPKGATVYDVSVTKPVVVAGQTVDMTFTQKNNVENEISGVGDSFDSNRTVTGVILMRNTEGQKAFLNNSSLSRYKMEIKDETGTTVEENVTIHTSTGIFSAENLVTDQKYTLELKYSLNDTEFLVVGKSEVMLNSNGEMNISEVLIDPCGIITDSESGEPIPGVYVVLHFDDGTVVELPPVSDFPPADNANPQYSDTGGNYAFMVFPDRNYYITAVKAGYEDFISEIIHVGTEIVRYDFQMHKKVVSSASSKSSKEIPDPADLAITIQSDAMKVHEGDTISFTVTYANKTEYAIDNLYIKIVVPDSMSFVAAGENGVLTGKEIKWSLDTFAEKTVGELTFKLMVNTMNKGEDYAKVISEIGSDKPFNQINPEDDTSMIQLMLYSDRYEHQHNRYIKGYPDGQVKSERLIIRAEVAAIFARTLDLRNDVQNVKLFKDVDTDYWGAEYIEVVAMKGLFKGYEDNTFRPDNSITRAELAIAIARYLEIAYEKNIDQLLKLSTFTDTKNHWAEQSIEEIFRFKIVSGYGDANFKPDQQVTREEAIKMFNRMLYRGPLTDVDSSYTDNNSSSWSFGDMEEATRTHYYKLNEDGTESMTEYVSEPLW